MGDLRGILATGVPGRATAVTRLFVAEDERLVGDEEDGEIPR